jgi:hypothetical protein
MGELGRVDLGPGRELGELREYARQGRNALRCAEQVSQMAARRLAMQRSEHCGRL